MTYTKPMTAHLYKALALQTRCDAVNAAKTRESAEEIMRAGLSRMKGQILSARAFHGPSLRLVCLPEYALTSYPAGETAAEWRDKAALDPGGEIYAAIGAVAAATGVHLGINAYETDPAFPELYFQASTIWAPSGDCILRYRRLISMYAPSPWDVWDRYIAEYGAESLFPVAATELGSLAALASEEILYPEIARCLALNGAEVLLHPTSEAASTLASPKNVAKIARAQENALYVVSANSAGIYGTPLAPHSTDGRSQIVDDRGIKLAEVPTGESITACADIDLASLRARRARVGMDNRLHRVPTELFAQIFASHAVHPPNTLGDGSAPPTKDFYRDRQAGVIAGRKERQGDRQAERQGKLD